MQVLLALVVILNLTLILKAHVPVCFPAEELDANLQRIFKRQIRKGLIANINDETGLRSLAKSKTTRTCPIALYATSPAYSNRSISPWTLSLDVDETRYPPKIAVAQCLCKGCIINGAENTGYVSVPVSQSKMVLKKIPCSLGDTGSRMGYRLETEYIDVPIACTCVVPHIRHMTRPK